MADEILKRDQNTITVLGGVTDDSSQNIVMLRVDPITKRLKVSASGGSGSGTVTSVSVTTANGVSGVVANPTTTPAITITLGAITPTTVNGLTINTTTGTLAIANGKTVTLNNSITFSGTDSTTMTFPTTSATLARTDAGNTFTGVSTASAWVLTSPTITTKISPTSNDGAPLGDTTHNFSDLFLASGGVINWNAGDATITHSSGLLTFSASSGSFFSPAGIALQGANAAGYALISVVDNISSNKSLTLTLNDASHAINLTGNLTVTGTVSIVSITEVTGTSQSAAVNKEYITNNAGLVTVTLPSTASSTVGDKLKITGSGAGGWRVAQNASQQIKWTAGGVAGTNETTAGTGGHIDSTDRYDAVELTYIASNIWAVTLSKGNIGLT